MYLSCRAAQCDTNSEYFENSVTGYLNVSLVESKRFGKIKFIKKSKAPG